MGAFPSSKMVSARNSCQLHPVANTNEWNYTSIFLYVFMKWCLIKQNENITLTLYQTVGHLHTDHTYTHDCAHS